MPECTPEERVYLDAMTARYRNGAERNQALADARKALVASRVEGGLKEAAIAAHAACHRAYALRDKAWGELNAVGIDAGMGEREFSDFYDEVERLGKERAGLDGR